MFDDTKYTRTDNTDGSVTFKPVEDDKLWSPKRSDRFYTYDHQGEIRCHAEDSGHIFSGFTIPVLKGAAFPSEDAANLALSERGPWNIVHALCLQFDPERNWKGGVLIIVYNFSVWRWEEPSDPSDPGASLCWVSTPGQARKVCNVLNEMKVKPHGLGE